MVFQLITLWSFIFVQAPEPTADFSGGSLDKRPVVLTVFPPPEGSRTYSTNVAGLELAYQSNPEAQTLYRYVHKSVPNQIHQLAKEVTDAIHQYRPQAIIGGSTSNSAFVISDIAEKAGIPFITPWATHPKLTEGKTRSFRICFDDHYQARTLADFVVNDQKIKEVFVFINSSEIFSVGVSQIFIERFKELGGRVLGEHRFQNEKEIEESVWQKLSEQPPQLIFLPSYELEAAALLTRMVGRLPESTVYLGPDAWSGGKMIQAVLNGLGLKARAYYVEHYSEDSVSTANQQYLRLVQGFPLNYLGGLQIREWMNREKLSGTSRSGIALGYDAGLVVFRAFQLARAKNISIDRALRESKVQGVTGEIEYAQSPTPDKGLFIYALTHDNSRFVKAYRR